MQMYDQIIEWNDEGACWINETCEFKNHWVSIWGRQKDAISDVGDINKIAIHYVY